MSALLDRYIEGAVAFAADPADDDVLAHFDIAEQIGQLEGRDADTTAIKLAVAEHVRSGAIDLGREPRDLADVIQLAALRDALAAAPLVANKLVALGSAD